MKLKTKWIDFLYKVATGSKSPPPYPLPLPLPPEADKPTRGGEFKRGILAFLRKKARIEEPELSKRLGEEL